MTWPACHNVCYFLVFVSKKYINVLHPYMIAIWFCRVIQGFFYAECKYFSACPPRFVWCFFQSWITCPPDTSFCNKNLLRLIPQYMIPQRSSCLSAFCAELILVKRITPIYIYRHLKIIICACLVVRACALPCRQIMPASFDFSHRYALNIFVLIIHFIQLINDVVLTLKNLFFGPWLMTIMLKRQISCCKFSYRKTRNSFTCHCVMINSYNIACM